MYLILLKPLFSFAPEVEHERNAEAEEMYNGGREDEEMFNVQVLRQKRFIHPQPSTQP